MFEFKAISKFAILASLAMLIAFSAGAQDARIRPVPIVVGGDPDMAACGSVGKVEGLDPRGDGFLAVKAAPSFKAPRIDKIYNGQMVTICPGDNGDWYGIIYGPPKQDCNVTKPRSRAGPYTGPCRWGWAHKRWINAYAG
jgi:hypothetical protein